MSSALRCGNLPLCKISLSSAQSSIPAFLYGSAWKKENSTSLVFQALESGFVGIDTAAQPKHYREDLVGEAVAQYISEHGKARRREDLFIQTKYTPISGQDSKNMPYDSQLPVDEQIKKSLTYSLRHFQMPAMHGVDQAQEPYIDCLIMHTPLPTPSETLSAWRVMEDQTPRLVRNLGISNIDLPTLTHLYGNARVKPAVVQNRFYSGNLYDGQIRKFCVEKGIVYQAFWTLTANPGLLKSKPVANLAAMLRISNQLALYCLVLGLDNIVILNGTTNAERMKEDIQGLEKAREWVEKGDGSMHWPRLLGQFKALIGDV